VVSPDGNSVYVAGYSFGNGEEYTTIAYDARAGAHEWLSHLDWTNNYGDSPRAVVLSPDGSMVFVGGTCIYDGSDHCTVAYEASTGDQIWAVTHNGPGHTADQGIALAVSPDGTQVFDTGFDIAGPNAEDYATVAYDAATGRPTWVGRLDGTAHLNDVAQAVAVSPDGSMVFVTGSIDNAQTGTDYGTVAYDAHTGVRLWLADYDGPANGYDAPTAIAASPDGSLVFVTGRSFGGVTGTDYATVAYSTSTGNTMWVSRSASDGAGFDRPTALVVAPDGATVIVTGELAGPTGPDYGTIAYDASSGDELWRAIYDGGRRDLAEGLAVAPDGSAVYVTGSSKVRGEGFDYVTVAYAT
jgi:DNA-binding beta-propeller fold protein YncE